MAFSRIFHMLLLLNTCIAQRVAVEVVEPPPKQSSTTAQNTERPANYPFTGAQTPTSPPPSINILPTSTSLAVPQDGQLESKVAPSSLLTWPDYGTDELEDIMFLQTGHNARNFSQGITPCGYSPFGPSRHGAGEYLRTAFHDAAPGSAVGVSKGIGGLDGSIQYELNTPGGGENIGAGFNTSLAAIGKHFSPRASVADLIALGVYAAVRVCGGPIIPVRTGRVDAKYAGPLGVPQPQNDVGTFTNQFARMGFNVSEMIQLVACGHGIGGVGSGDFPTIVNPKAGANGSNAMVESFAAFSSGSVTGYSEKVATEYMAGNGSDPLVAGQCMQSKRCSDIIVFNADGNATISKMTDPQVYRKTCQSLLQRMIELVPKTTKLSAAPLRPYEVKPSGLELSIMDGGNVLWFQGEIRVRTTDRPASSIKSVKVIYQTQTGGTCNSCIISTEVSGTAKGFDDEFTFYKFSTFILSKPLISSFYINVSRTDNTIETFDNNGQKFPIQNNILFQPSQSCLSAPDSAGRVNLTIQAAVRNNLPNPTVNVTLALPTTRPKIPIPAFTRTSLAMTPVNFVGPYIIYSSSYTLNATQVEKGKFDLVANLDYTNSFKSMKLIGSKCTAIGIQKYGR